uniref:Btz domain-containing protein n=1 Tax=Periophthalmus magnuspinnatus TaxID=409849 RepID=A0A3B4BGV7_9GOBI
MSKPESPMKSRSKSRSRSRSYSRSHSRSRSRSRSRKRRYSSRSRSRSYSPSYRNYPSRDYQNNRGGYNRGYNRGYRRPFHYRGRNRGYHHRGGHYQNRGGGYGYKSNWQGGGWYDKEHSPRRGRSRSRSRKRSGSRSRSSCPLLLRSRSSSHHRSGKGKSVKDHKKPAESPGPKPGAEGSAIEKASGGKWIDYETSPKPSSPDRAAAKKEESGVENKGPGAGGPMWRTIGSVSPPKPSPPATAQTAAFGGFGFFSKEDPAPSDKAEISAAFKKYFAYKLSWTHVLASLRFCGAFSSVRAARIWSTVHPVQTYFDFLSAAYAIISTIMVSSHLPLYKTVIEYLLLISCDSTPRDPEEPEGAPEEEPYRRKHKKEEKKKKEKKEKRRSPSPREKERPLFPGAFPARAESPQRLAASREEFEQKVSAMGLDELPRDVIPSKKDAEFRSIFQHIQGSRRSPSELFAQHLVSIVHYIKAQHFPSADLSLSERFALYQKKAEEAELMKPRKSPEIHRRIDVSPSAFKRHCGLFEEVEENAFKVTWSLLTKKKRDRSPSSSSSSSSPSPYPPYRAKDYSEGPMEHPEEGYSHQRYPPHGYGPGPREYEGHGMDRGRGRGFFPRVRGRGWNRGNYQGNNSNGNPANMNPQQRPPEEEWDPEYTPKSRKYYLHDDRDGEKTWVDNRGRGRGAFPNRRGRFVYRKGGAGGAGGTSPKWTHDMYQGGEEGEIHDEGCDEKGQVDNKP